MTTSKKGGARAIADLTQGTILATVEIAAPRERVFRALTDPKEIVNWWGSPETYQTSEWTSDLRTGGKFRAVGRGADGVSFAVEGDYLLVDPPNKLVHTWKADWDDAQPTTVTMTLDAIGGGTRVTLRHDGFAGRPESCRDHGAGWEMILGWLEAHATERAPAASAPSYYMCRLIPPRPSFPLDMSDAERAIMSEHVGYWSSLMRDGVAVVFGPVLDPAGAWGAGVVGVEREDQLALLQANDPAIRSGIGFRYEAHAMPGAIARR